MGTKAERIIKLLILAIKNTEAIMGSMHELEKEGCFVARYMVKLAEIRDEFLAALYANSVRVPPVL